MIRVVRRPPPEHFDRDVRQPGLRWLSNPQNRQKRRPKDFWRHCRDELEREFESRCGYAATWISSGHIDHHASWNRCKRCDEHHRAYEWENLRWIAPELNSLKSDHELLDPFEVEDGWFEIHLPSLHLVMTAAIPPEHRDRAETTLRVLKLVSGRPVMKWRQEELRLYVEGNVDLATIARRTPLLSRALKKLLSADPEHLDPEQRRFRAEIEARRRRAGAPL